ncbi:MAG TPA: ATP synthase F1 subunit delta [Bryobacteraceae bacterium]|nr:ATP synthase F1 subunit delta [Bryobacteraceae bacterium]
MRLSAVVTRYANALADVVTASAAALQPQAALQELRAFEAVLESSEELRQVLSTPAIPNSRKKAVVGRIAGMLKLSQITRNFLFVLIDHGRMASLQQVVRSFDQTVDERLGFARAEISSACELTEAQRAALNTELQQVTGKRIRMRFAVDEGLIGGVVARIGSTVYDGSVRGQLKSLQRRLGAES